MLGPFTKGMITALKNPEKSTDNYSKVTARSTPICPFEMVSAVLFVILFHHISLELESKHVPCVFDSASDSGKWPVGLTPDGLWVEAFLPWGHVPLQKTPLEVVLCYISEWTIKSGGTELE